MFLKNLEEKDIKYLKDIQEIFYNLRTRYADYIEDDARDFKERYPELFRKFLVRKKEEELEELDLIVMEAANNNLPPDFVRLSSELTMEDLLSHTDDEIFYQWLDKRRERYDILIRNTEKEFFNEIFSKDNDFRKFLSNRLSFEEKPFSLDILERLIKDRDEVRDKQVQNFFDKTEFLLKDYREKERQCISLL